MDQHRADIFISENHKYLPEEKSPYLKERLKDIDEDKFLLISAAKLKSPRAVLLISIFLGGFGVDRFMIGDTGIGVLKLLTGGCCGMLTIADWFTISKRTKEANFDYILSLI